MSSSPGRIVIRNARQHNLKGITVELPRRALTVITGPSGAGKSSLAFDTLYAEGQRRYIESLSTYAKQFLERMPKPLVDALEGISPAVAIEQKNPTTTSRSTVGTATEIYDFLRLLWARVGTPHCVACGQVVKTDTVQEVVDELMGRGTGDGDLRPRRPIVVTFPCPPRRIGRMSRSRRSFWRRGSCALSWTGLSSGWTTPMPSSASGKPRTCWWSWIAWLVGCNRGRLADAVATAFNEGEGVAVALDNGSRQRFSEHPTCSHCGTPAGRC